MIRFHTQYRYIDDGHIHEGVDVTPLVNPSLVKRKGRMRAIELNITITKLLEVRFGESDFKTVDEFWTDFKPDGGEKSTNIKANVIKDTEGNRNLVIALEQMYKEQKAATDAFEQKVIRLRNQFKK